MASKVLVKIPVTPFGHVNKGKASAADVAGATTAVTAEIVTVGTGPGTSRCTDPLLRTAQLEQNIRFLQEQHQLMLTGLHQEIDSLRQRNRDLQFQLVFSKGSIASPNSASSPEEEAKTRVLSPRQVNVTPLQVELLERELGELKVTLHEVNTRNAYLTAIVDEQKKKLERADRERGEREQQPVTADPELLSKLDDVESLVRKLRRENDDLRREVSDARASSGGGGQHGGGGGGGGGGQHRGGRHRGGGGHHYRGHRFPPLHTQSYWQGGRSGDKDGEGPSGGTSLPSLNMNGQPQQQPQPGQHYQGGHGGGGGGGGGKRTGNNNHHQYHQGGGHGGGGGGGGGGKYRGSQSRGHKS